MIQGRVAAEGTLDEVARRPEVVQPIWEAPRHEHGPHAGGFRTSERGMCPASISCPRLSLAAAENAVHSRHRAQWCRQVHAAACDLRHPASRSAGRVLFRGEDVTGANPSTLKAAGVSYVTQDINSFPLLTRGGEPADGRVGVPPRPAPPDRRQLESVYAMFPILKDKRRDSAGSLSGGQGRMLSVARELMTQPSLLLIDEPTVGLAPNLVATGL